MEKTRVNDQLKYIIEDLIKTIEPYLLFPISVSYVRTLLMQNQETIRKWLKRNQQKISQL